MTDLINQITINGQTTTFLNYVNPLVGGESIVQDASSWNTFFTQQLTSLRYVRSSNLYYNLRFNVPFETMTGAVTSFNGLSDNARTVFRLGGDGRGLNSTNSTTTIEISMTGNNTWYYRNYAFAVINNYGLAMAFFSNEARNANVNFYLTGWPRDRQFTGSQYPRNFYSYGDREDASPEGYRVTQENQFTLTQLQASNPTLSCATPTSGANATDVLMRDLNSPNWYIGKFQHVITLPPASVVGKIYKNTGIDPDTGSVETDQKAFWMCVGSFGSNKIGMRVWTENIT